MTQVTIYKNKENECVGFRALGHAGYAEAGEDIVCAAISVLIINTINAIETYTDVSTSANADDESGLVVFRLIDKPTAQTTLLLDTMVLGLETMADNKDYSEFIDLRFEEV